MESEAVVKCKVTSCNVNTVMNMWNRRMLELLLPGANFRSLELLFPRTFAPRRGNFRSMERMFQGTFALWNFRTQELLPAGVKVLCVLFCFDYLLVWKLETVCPAVALYFQ